MTRRAWISAEEARSCRPGSSAESKSSMTLPSASAARSRSQATAVKKALRMLEITSA